MTLYEQFINDVEVNPDNHNEFVKLSVNRHLTDLQKKDFEYTFDKTKADRAIKIIKLLRHTQGDFYGRLFDLQPYQAFITAMLFGWVRKSDGIRRFLKAYIEHPRKGGKSEYAAAIEVLCTFFDGENKPAVYTAATKSDQAEYVYAAAKSMCKQLSKDSPIFSQRIRIMQYEIKELETDGFITKMTADSKTEDGANPSCAVVDEYHAHKDDSIVKILETGMGQRAQPLLFIITTAGYDKFSACYAFRNVIVGILKGQIINERVFGIIFTLDEGDEIHDKSKWIKAMPNLGNAPKKDMIEAMYQNAITEGSSALVDFMTKNLNMWTDAAKVWITDDDWTSLKIEEPELTGQDCYIGLDLSSRVDLTAVCYYFPSIKYFKVHFYCPDEKVKAGRRSDGVDYLEFIKTGNLTATPGNVIDYEYIIADIFDSCELYNVKMIGYDPFNADLIIPKFVEYGIETGAIRQGFLSISPPTKKLEVMVLSKEIFHSGCPIMRWNISNVELETDAAGNIKPSKAKSKNKIDGVAALVTAIGAYMHVEINEEGEITLEQVKRMYESSNK
jgi:phage terminase large subunit-like protein